MGLLRRRAATLGYRLLAFVRSRRWILLSLGLAVTGLLGLRFQVPGVVNAVLAVISLVMVVPEFVNFARERQRIQFQERTSDEFDDVREWTVDRPRFTFLGLRSGAFLLDKAATAAIASGKLTARLEPDRYRIPAEIAGPAAIFLERRIANRLDVFNGAVLGLDTNLGVADASLPAEVGLRRGTYFDHLSSDLFAARDVHSERRHVVELGRGLVIDRRGSPRDFGDSWLLNALGTSVVAITRDGWIVGVHQTSKNESSPDQLAPSGSGSLEPCDLRGPVEPFVEVAIRGGLREMQQEAGITPADVESSALLGFGRWLDKGGKPELLCVAGLVIDSHEARRRRRSIDDRPFSKFAEPCRLLQAPEDWDPDNVGAMVGRRHALALSLPLQVSLHLMARAAHLPDTPAHRVIVAAMEDRSD